MKKISILLFLITFCLPVLASLCTEEGYYIEQISKNNNRITSHSGGGGMPLSQCIPFNTISIDIPSLEENINTLSTVIKNNLVKIETIRGLLEEHLKVVI